MSKMKALNRAFERAFNHTATKETLTDLLSCLGEELSCDRIAIFEMREDDTFDNTYEWCKEGVAEEKNLLQNQPQSLLDTLRVRLIHDERLVIEDIHALQESNPDAYTLFASQGVKGIILSLLAFHGQNLGFFALENPDQETFDEVDVFLQGMRYILSSLLYSDHLVRRLTKLGLTDRLTGLGNRRSLQEKLDALEKDKPVGLLYLVHMGNYSGQKMGHLKEEQMIVHLGRLLLNLFGEECTFRLGEGDFLVMLEGISRDDFQMEKTLLVKMLAEADILAAVGELYQEKLLSGTDECIRKAHMEAFREKRLLQKAQEEKDDHSHFPGEAAPERANILLPHEEAFYQKAETFLKSVFDQPVLLAVVDVNYFKLYNDIFGRRAGDRLLEEIAGTLEVEAAAQRGLAGYLGGDNFILMLPVEHCEKEENISYVESLFAHLEYAEGFTPAMGIYLSQDRQESVITMYDRALMSLQEIKGSYMDHYHFYDANLYQHQREDKMLLMDIREGLPQGEFLVYFQPQVQERTGKVVRAEALVRWQKGEELIPPARFIPLLEKTGYVFAVDCFVWEEVARWIRHCLDQGITPVPISVNVSRVDFYFTDIAEYFISLVKRYDIAPYYLGVEITESAFTDNMDLILSSVQKLHEAGFRLLMDDFGSGSSSLSMLHTMNLDVLKTDVRFMSRKKSDTKAVSIVESVITMAHLIGMLVVTEGVETEEQKNNLIAMGDNYAQGFYFYHPMPKAEFEHLLLDRNKIGEPPVRGQNWVKGSLGFRTMIREGMVSDALLDNIIGPAAVFEEMNGAFHMVQANDQYIGVLGQKREYLAESMQVKTLLTCFAGLHDMAIPPEGLRRDISFQKPDGEELSVSSKIFRLYNCEEHHLYLCLLTEEIR